jgi:hypothetical protein
VQSFTNVGICCPTPGAGRSGTWTGVQKSEPASEETSVQALIKLINRGSNLGYTRRGYGCNTNSKKDTGA